MTTQPPASLGLSALDQVGLSCTDLDAARRFYCDTLGLRDAGEIPNTARLFDCAGVNLIVFKSPQPSPASILYFKVPGTPGLIQAKTAALRAAGVEILQDPQCIARNWHGHDVYLAFFKDPFGNTLALKSDVPAQT